MITISLPLRWLRPSIAFAALIVAPIPGLSQSLWPADNDDSASLTTDRKAKQVGDVVTILVTETTAATQAASSSTSKKSKEDIGPATGPLVSLFPKFAFSGDSSNSSQGATSRTSSVTTRISAKIVKVNPNGTMLVEGTREVVANKDTQTVKITGLVRAQDISPENTVLSTYIADAKIEVTGRGPIDNRHKEGIVTRLLRFLF